MSDKMTFPDAWEEFEKSYGFIDSEEVYTNGARLIPSFRVKQWLDHIAQSENKQQATGSGDCIYRQQAIDSTYAKTVSTNPEHFKSSEKFIGFMDNIDISEFGRWQWANGFNTALVATKIQLEKLPSAEPRKKGKWIEIKYTFHHKCSNCEWINNADSGYNFCPNCGSYNGGEEE